MFVLKKIPDLTATLVLAYNIGISVHVLRSLSKSIF